MKAYHFLYEGNKMRGGKVAPIDGDWLEVEGEVKLCAWGLHASVSPWHAFQHAPGPILCLVELEGTIIEGTDKVVASRRKIIKRFDATKMLQYFARMQALSVIHLWNAPDIVLDFLMTGDNRDAARAAASATASATAWATARAAASATAWAAASAAARDAASATANATASATAWDASWATARAAASATASATAWATAWDAASATANATASATAWDASWDASWATARAEFNKLVEECFD